MQRENDGRYPDGSDVEVWYPRPGDDEHDRSTWSWCPGWIVLQCEGSDDEWQIAVDVPETMTLEDGTIAPPGTPSGDLYYPVVFRTSEEIRKPQ